MKNGVKRVPFGNETIYDVITFSCPSCNTRVGNFHEYGCSMETCPQCGCWLLKCSCKALGFIDEIKLTRAIAKGITDRAEINYVLEYGSRDLDRSYYESGVMTWLLRNRAKHNPAHREKMKDFMALLGFRPVGGRYTATADSVAAHLGVTTEEAQELLKALQPDPLPSNWQKCDGSVQ